MNRLAVSLTVMFCAAALLAGCKPYVIEYHRRPAYYSRMSDQALPDRIVLDDGTVMVFNDADPSAPSDDGKKTFKIREEMEDGSTVLRALLPEHVIANALNCIRNEEYELLWDQMLAEQTRLAYAGQGMGVEEFTEFFRKHRIDLARTLNRMLLGIAQHEVIMENVGGGVTECRFWPQLAQHFKFKSVALVSEDFNLKLLLIY